jgi:hypothetical protein
MLTVDFGTPSYEFTVNIWTYLSLLYTQENNIKEETFGISSSSTSREDHEARHKSRHEVNKTPNNPKDQCMNT